MNSYSYRYGYSDYCNCYSYCYDSYENESMNLHDYDGCYGCCDYDCCGYRNCCCNCYYSYYYYYYYCCCCCSCYDCGLSDCFDYDYCCAYFVVYYYYYYDTNVDAFDENVGNDVAAGVDIDVDVGFDGVVGCCVDIADCCDYFGDCYDCIDDQNVACDHCVPVDLMYCCLQTY